MAIYVYSERSHQDWSRQIQRVVDERGGPRGFERNVEAIRVELAELVGRADVSRHDRKNFERFAADALLLHGSIARISSGVMRTLLRDRQQLDFANLRQRAFAAFWLSAWAQTVKMPFPDWAQTFVGDFITRTNSVPVGSPTAKKLAPIYPALGWELRSVS